MRFHRANEVDEENIEILFTLLDVDGSGFLDWGEFYKLCDCLNYDLWLVPRDSWIMRYWIPVA